MRIYFQEKPYDLVAVFALTAILAPLAFFGVTGTGRITMGLIFILFVPGYVLTAALFPENTELGWIERLALAVGLSIALAAFIGLGLNFTPWGIFLEPVLASLLLFTYAVGGLAWRRRSKLPVGERIALSIRITKPHWASNSRADKIATIALVLSLIFAAASVVYVVVTPRPAEKFTEFYILNATGVAGGYPTNLTVNEPATINFTVHNREFADVAYEIRIYRATMEAYFNVSANRTELRELSRTYVSNFSLQLGNDGYWNRSYTFNVSSPGIYRLYFNLYKLPNTQDVYRYLFLTVRVRG